MDRFFAACVALILVSASSGCSVQDDAQVYRELDGVWEGTYTSTTDVGTNGLECTDGSIKSKMTDGILEGSATNTYGDSYAVSGRAIDSKSMEGRFELSGVTVGKIQGSLSNGRMDGTFVDAEDCRGNWVVYRVE